jgi:hypothetical protein
MASSDLAAAQSDVGRDPSSARAALVIWLGKSPGWAKPLLAAAPRSLYAPRLLAAAAAPASSVR